MARTGKAQTASPKGHQKALVVGVSEYPDPDNRLPAVAADVREMAKVLSSKHGTFSRSGVTVLADQRATHDKVMSALHLVFSSATQDDTVFVYFAGHGGVLGDNYFFVAYDTAGECLAETGIPLRGIKTLFDQTKSQRVLLWLDFCHSGGILARNTKNTSDMAAIRRAVGIVSGHGKVIVAACTPTQFAYEDAALGHGCFTHALLQGLRGDAKSAQGEVTALSLYEYIDHQVTNKQQQPVFFGEMTGRIVLAYYAQGTVAPPTTSAKQLPTKDKPQPLQKTGTWIMLGDHFFPAKTIRHHSDGTLDLTLEPADAEEEASIAALRPSQYGGTATLPFAAKNDAHAVRVKHIETETANGCQTWMLSLEEDREHWGGGITSEISYGVDDKTYTPDDIAKLRAGRILLNDPSSQLVRHRGLGNETLLNGMIEDSCSRYPVRECVVRSVFNSHGQSPNWRTFARLRSVFLLKASGIVEHILELKIGAVRDHKVSVSFRGRRPQHYSNVSPETVEVSGICSVD